MAFNLKNKRRRLKLNDSSDSESDIPFYKKKRLQHVNIVKKSLQTLCDNDSSPEKNSDDDIKDVRQNSITNCIGLTDINNDENKKSETTYDNALDASTENKKKKTINENSNDTDSDNSFWNSSIPLIQYKGKSFRTSHINKNNNKVNTDEVSNHSQVVQIQSNEEDYSDSSIIPSSPLKNNQKVKGKKEDIPSNFKPYITKVMKELKHRFTKFKSQISRLQQKYLKDDVVTLQDAEDTIFILTCIISRMKEEFTNQQRDLTDSYIQRIMKQNT